MIGLGRGMRALPLLLLTGCALFRPDPNLSPRERASRAIRACVRSQLFEAATLRRVLFTHCGDKVNAYCAAVGQPPGCQDGRDEYRLWMLWTEPPPNPNHIGGP